MQSEMDVLIAGITQESVPEGVSMRIRQVDMLVRKLEITNLSINETRTLAEAYGSNGRSNLTKLMKEVATKLENRKIEVMLPPEETKT